MDLIYHCDMTTRTNKVLCPETSTMVAVAGNCFQCEYFSKTKYKDGLRYIVCNYQKEEQGLLECPTV